MNLPSTHDHPGASVRDILTGQEYDLQPVELGGATVYRWVCHPCGGQTGGVAYSQSEGDAERQYVEHYERHHNAHGA